MIPWINMGDRPHWLRIDRVIQKYRTPGGQCHFIAELCLEARTGYTGAVAVFWQEKPAQPEYSNYFGIFRQSGAAVITNAVSVSEGFWHGRMHPETGEIIFSRERHDYRTSRDGKTVVVDGGRDYFRGHGGIPVRMKIIDGRMRIIEFAEQV